MYGKMSSQLVSLTWDGHHRTLVNVFEKLLVNSHFVDCTIAAEGQKMKAHREILSAFSPFFELLFSEETENNPTVIISGISFTDLRSLVDFMYHGKLEVTEDRIQDLIEAAECLQIKGLGGCHKEDDSGNKKNTKVLTHKRTRKGETEVAASIDSKESEVNKLNSSYENSVVIASRQSSRVQNLMPNYVVQNVAIVSNISLMPDQSTLSEIEMDSLHLQDQYMVKKEPDLVEDENTHINEPMRDASRKKYVCGNSGNGGQETIVGLPTDISVTSEKNVYEDLPLYCAPPEVMCSQLCSRVLTVSSIKNELGNINVNLSSEPVDHIESAVDTQVSLLQSQFHMKTVDEILLSMNNDLINENDEFSGNIPESTGVPSASDRQLEMVCTEERNDCSGAASGCVSESSYCPQKLSAAAVKMQRPDRNEPALVLMPGVSADVNPPIHPSHTTPVCERDLPGPTGRDVSNGSCSTDMAYHCQTSNKTFRRNRSLGAHMRTHAGDRRFRYDESNYAAVASIKLNEHQLNQSGRKLCKCTLCDFKSVHPSALSVHMRIHKGWKPYKCTECEYTSAYSSNLKIHQRTHRGLKRYKCTECGYRTVQSNTLKIHQRMHSGVKPYKCTECEFTTAYGSHLKRHQRSHSGLKPHQCTECSYATTRRDALRSHQRTHSRLKL